MNLNNQNLARVSLLLSLAVVFSIAGYYIIFLSILTFFCGSIFVIIGLISEKKSYAISSFLAYTFLIFMFLDPFSAMMHAFVLSMPCVVLGYLLKNPENEDLAFLAGTTLSAIAFMLIFLILGKTVMTEFFDEIKQSVEISNNMIKNLNIDNPNILSADELITQMKNIFPSAIVVFSLLNVLINKYLGFKIFKRMFPKENLVYKPFREFKIPDKVIFFFLLCSIIFYFLQLYMGEAYLKQVSTNITSILIYILAIQGFSIVIYVIHNYKGINKALAVILLILFMQSLILLLPFVAILDMFFDIRKQNFRRPK